MGKGYPNASYASYASYGQNFTQLPGLGSRFISDIVHAQRRTPLLRRQGYLN